MTYPPSITKYSVFLGIVYNLTVTNLHPKHPSTFNSSQRLTKRTRVEKTKDVSMSTNSKLTKAIVIKETLWVSVLTALSKGIRFIGTILLVRLLSPEDFGAFYIWFSIISMFQLLRLPFRAALVQKLNQEEMDFERQERAIGTTFSLKIIFGSLAFLLTWVMIPHFYSSVGEPMDIGRMLSFTVILLPLSEMPRHLLSWKLKMREIGSIDLVREISFVTVSLIFAWQGYKVWSLVYGEVASQAIGLIASWVLSPQVISLALDMKETKELVKYALFITGASLLSWITNQVDRLILGIGLGQSLLGYYVLALSLITIPVRITGHFNKVVYPSFCKLQTDMHRLTKAVELVLNYTLTLAIPFALAIFTLADFVIPVLYTDRWLPAAAIVRLLVVFPITESTLRILKSLFNATGKPNLVFRINLIRSIGFLILTPPLAYYWGILGVTTGVVLSSLADVTLCLWYSRTKLRLKLKLGALLASASIMSVLLFLIANKMEPNLLHLLCLIGLGIIVYVACLWIFGEKELVKGAWKVAIRLYYSIISGFKRT